MPIAPGSLTQLPPNSTGPKLATGPTYTENANVVQDEKTINGEQYLATYTFVIDTNAVTINSHMAQIMAGASLNVRLRKVEFYQGAVATAAAYLPVGLFRLTTAGTGGTVVAGQPLDPADAAIGATSMLLPTVKGTEGAQLYAGQAMLIQTIGASTPQVQPVLAWDFDRLRSKPPIIAAGVTKGLCIKNTAAIAAASIRIVVTIDEFSWA